MEALRGVESRSTNIIYYLLFLFSVGNRKLLTSLGKQSLGGLCDRGTPDPISNSAVKPISADGTSPQGGGE